MLREPAKRRLQVTGPVLLVICHVCVAQTPRMPPPRQNMAVAKSEFEDAVDAWRQYDPNLERDFALATAGPAGIKVRIRRAAELREIASAKHQAYVDLIISRIQVERSEWAKEADPTIPVDARRKSLQFDQGQTQAALEDVEARLRALPEGAADLRQMYEEQRNTLRNQSGVIAANIRTLDNIGKEQAVRPDLMREIALEDDAVLESWKKVRSDAIDEAARFKDYYSAMERDLDKRMEAIAPKTSSRSASGKANKGTAIGGASIGIPKEGASAGLTNLVGAWIYRPPGEWRGYGEPQSVTLELSLDGDTIRGTYTARLPTPGGLQDVRFSVEGRLRSRGTIRLRWTSQNPPGTGDMDLSLGADGRLSVERRGKSGKTTIPDGVETLVRRS